MPGPSQQQPNQQTRTRTQSAPPPAPPAPSAAPAVPASTAATAAAKASSGFKAGEAQRVAGKAGEHSLTDEWISVQVGNAQSARLTVRTAAGNGLTVTIEQAVYKRTFEGTGSVETSVIPVAPIGTEGKISARDTTTGEELERPYVWRDMGGGGGFSLWAMIKRLLGGT